MTDKIYIVGYEGARRGVAVNWGAAAVIRNGDLVNCVSGYSQKNGEYLFKEYVEEQVIEPLEQPIQITMEQSLEKLYVFDFPIELFYREPYHIDSELVRLNVYGCIASITWQQRAYHVFESHEKFAKWNYHLTVGNRVVVSYADFIKLCRINGNVE